MIQHQLGAIGIDVTIRKVTDLEAAIHSASRFDLLDMGSHFPYPDPASFLEQVFEDVPSGWLPPVASAGLRSVTASGRPKRLLSAASLADRLVRDRALLVAYGTPQVPQFLAPRVGCRVFISVSYGVDLARLCQETS